MEDIFNPYHRWLGIPKEDLPADYYRLLGLARFEDNPEVIEDSAARQMAHVRSKSIGQYQELSQKILNELTVAKLCLLNATEKKAYDDKFRLPLASATNSMTLPLPAQPLTRPFPNASTVPLPLPMPVTLAPPPRPPVPTMPPLQSVPIPQSFPGPIPNGPVVSNNPHLTIPPLNKSIRIVPIALIALTVLAISAFVFIYFAGINVFGIRGGQSDKKNLIVDRSVASPQGDPGPTNRNAFSPRTSPEILNREMVPTLGSTLRKTRNEISDFNLEDAAKTLIAAEPLAKTTEELDKFARVKMLLQYSLQFRQALREVASGLQTDEPIDIGKATITVVLVIPQQDRIILRVAGANKAYYFREMPAAMALAIAERRLKKDNADDLLTKAAYAMTSKRSNDNVRKSADEWLKQAAQENPDAVNFILPLLKDNYEQPEDPGNP